MYRVNDSTVIATVTDLRRRTSEVLAAGEEGADVIVQKGDSPEGVYMSFEGYQSVMERLERLESLELAELAMQRKRAIDQGEAGTVSLEESFGVTLRSCYRKQDTSREAVWALSRSGSRSSLPKRRTRISLCSGLQIV